MQGVPGPMGPPGDPGKEGIPVCTSDSISCPCSITVFSGSNQMKPCGMQKCGKNENIVKRQLYMYMHMLNVCVLKPFLLWELISFVLSLSH